MRVVVLGDFHIPKNNPDMSKQAVDDVARCRPDLVVPLGDFGSPGKIGTPAGLKETYKLLRQIDAPMRPIIGNHDMERESGVAKQLPGTMRRLLLRLFDLGEAYGVIEKEDVRFVFVTTEYQSPDICYQVQECYASDRQYEAIETILKARPGVPVIMFSHAPPIGCGLRTVPATHVRATNAYLSQNHQPRRWLQLAQRFPEIVMWFSAHYHLGHAHKDSLSLKYGTWFFTTGVHGSATRDGDRHSRVIDLEEDRVRVRTLCHKTGKMDDRYEWVHRGTLRTLVQNKASGESEDRGSERQAANFGLDVSALETRGPTCVQRIPIVGATPIKGGLQSLSTGHMLLATGEGFVWEVEMDVESVIGSLYLDDDPVRQLDVSGTTVWMAAGHRLLFVKCDDMWRFIRTKRSGPRNEPLLFNDAITSMTPRNNQGVFIACGRRLLYLSNDVMNDIKLTSAAPSFFEYEMDSDVDQLVWDGGGGRTDILWIIDETRRLWRFDLSREDLRLYDNEVLAWDGREGDHVRVVSGGDVHPSSIKLIIETMEGSTSMDVTVELGSDVRENPSNSTALDWTIQALSFGNGKAAVAVNGILLYYSGEENTLVPLHTEGRVHALSCGRNDTEFFAAVTFSDDDRHTEIQRWQVP